MARKPMVTRTIKTTNVEVVALDTQTYETTNLTFVLPREVKDEKVALKRVKEEHESENLMIVKVVAITVNEQLYGMLETDFVQHADIIGAVKEETEERSTQA